MELLEKSIRGKALVLHVRKPDGARRTYEIEPGQQVYMWVKRSTSGMVLRRARDTEISKILALVGQR
jgi:hypothetical protein